MKKRKTSKAIFSLRATSDEQLATDDGVNSENNEFKEII